MALSPAPLAVPTAPAVDRLKRFAWGVLGYNLFVIAWGAFVRATGAGAGCGSHWPLCNGEVIPRAHRVETLIELGHRLTSGVALVLVVALVVGTFRVFPARSLPRRGAVASLALMLAEALLGAGLVLFELVAHDKSLKRALSISLHLTNTFFLLAALTLTAFWISTWQGTASAARGQAPPGKRRALLVLLVPCAAALVLVGMSGAVAALGDTLFPAPSLGHALAQDLSPAAHLFVRLRVLHPIFAIAAAVYVVITATAVRLAVPSPSVARASRALVALVLVQVTLGFLNMLLLAPVPMQLVHLVVADGVWIGLVLLGATASRAAAASGRDSQVNASRNGPAPTSDVPPSSSNVAPVM